VLDDIRLGPIQSRATVRAAYVSLANDRSLRSKEDVDAFAADLEAFVARGKLTRVLMDVRDVPLAQGAEAHAAVWAWLKRGAFDAVALVVEGQEVAMRELMTAIAHGARVRSFASLSEAHLWLAGRARGGSSARLQRVHADPARRKPSGTGGDGDR
jgi:hypothetical protein